MSKNPNTKNLIFFGNGLLADVTKSVLEKSPELKILFHARTKSDLTTVKAIKTVRKIILIRIIKPPPFDSLGRRFIFYDWECEGRVSG